MTATTRDAKQLERIMARAFAQAERSRVGAGMKARPTPITQTRDGSRRVGPRRYKMTIWLRPEEYLDLFEQMREERFRGTVTQFVAARASGHRLKRKQSEPRKLRAVG